LKDQAKQKWRELAASFDLASPLDVELLAQYCESFEMHCRAKKELDGDTMIHIAPNGAPYAHPSINIIIKTSDQMRRLYKQLEARRKTDGKNEDELEI
jgi:P27 family predicted phage terminase small subunit